MHNDEAENPELEAVVDEATADGEPGQKAARREVERLEDDDPDPQDGLQM